MNENSQGISILESRPLFKKFETACDADYSMNSGEYDISMYTILDQMNLSAKEFTYLDDFIQEMEEFLYPSCLTESDKEDLESSQNVFILSLLEEKNETMSSIYENFEFQRNLKDFSLLYDSIDYSKNTSEVNELLLKENISLFYNIPINEVVINPKWSSEINFQYSAGLISMKKFEKEINEYINEKGFDFTVDIYQSENFYDFGKEELNDPIYKNAPMYEAVIIDSAGGYLDDSATSCCLDISSVIDELYTLVDDELTRLGYSFSDKNLLETRTVNEIAEENLEENNKEYIKKIHCPKEGVQMGN